MASCSLTSMKGTMVWAPLAGEKSVLSSSSTRSGGCLVPPRANHNSTSKPVLVVKASSSENQKGTGRDLVAAFVAAGAALTISSQAFALPDAGNILKNKTDQLTKGAQNVTENVKGSGVIKNSLEGADNVANDIKLRIDGIFGKSKPFTGKSVASTGGGAIADAQSRIKSFGAKSQNPVATNIDKASKDFKNIKSGSVRASKEILGQDSTRVDEATRKTKNLFGNLQEKAGSAVEEAKAFVGQATSDLPNIQAPSLPNAGSNLLGGVKDSVQGAKGKVDSISSKASSNATDVKKNVTNGFQ